jgi:hypothetical protein
MPLEFRPVGSQRILVNTAATLTSYKYDQYGEVANPGTTTVTITRADDTVVTTAATATEDPTTRQLSIAYAAADNTQLDWLKAVWTDSGDSSTWTTYHEVVGGFYATVAEIRQRDPNITTEKYNATTIRAVMQEIEWAFELECGRAFVPRYGRARLSGSAGARIMLPDVDIRSLRGVRDYSDYDTYTSFTVAELAAVDWYPSGALTRIDGGYWYAGSGNYIVEYEHGMDRPPPDVKAAAIRWLRSVLNANKTGIPDRATTFSVESGGSYSLLTPGRNGSVTGIPDVDLVIERYRVKRFMVGV